MGFIHFLRESANSLRFRSGLSSRDVNEPASQQSTADSDVAQAAEEAGFSDSDSDSFETDSNYDASMRSNVSVDMDGIVPPEEESMGTIGDYDIIKVLGSGATATVKLGKLKSDAESSGQEEFVALKEFKTSLLKKMRDIKRVGRKMVVSTAFDKVQLEIAIMKKLEHKNLIKLLEVFDDDADTLVVMLEYAPIGQVMEWEPSSKQYKLNPEIAQTNQEDASMSETELRECVRQLLSGLEYLHNNNIAHRDLKPENILLGKDHVYKIADFGVAHFFEEEAEEKAPASTDSSKGFVSTTAGTYAFMAPETTKPDPFSAYMADLWALGITTYALAFNTIPYYDPDPTVLFDMIENQPMDLEQHGTASDGLKELLSGLLQKDPEQRWDIAKCKKCEWVTEGLTEEEKHAFWTEQMDTVEVSEEDLQKAVKRVTKLNVLLRVHMGAMKWRKKAKESAQSASSMNSMNSLTTETTTQE